MKLRDGENAVVDIAKLRLYCLDPAHPRGAPKARQFASRFGLTASDAESLREQLLDAARKSEAAEVSQRDDHGQRYELDVEITGPDGSGAVRSTWIVRSNQSPPHLITCYVL